MPITTKPPSASQVYLMISIGIGSMLIILLLLFNSAQRLITKNNDASDSVVVTYKKNVAVDTTAPVQVQSQKTFSKQKLLFNKNPDFLVWIVFITLMIAVATSLIPVLFLSVRDIFRNFVFNSVLKWKLFVLTIVILALIIFVSSNSNFLFTPIEVLENFRILLDSTILVKSIVIYSLAVGMIAVYGQLSVNQAISQFPDSIRNLTPDEIKQKGYDLKFILLRQKLRFFLICLATLIVFAIITTELVRKAILSEIKTNIDIVPHSFVYVYGLVFTFFLAVLYLPIYYRLRQKGVAMLEIAEGEEEEKEKQPVFKTFIIKETPLDSLKITLSILAPILTSLIPNVKIF